MTYLHGSNVSHETSDEDIWGDMYNSEPKSKFSKFLNRLEEFIFSKPIDTFMTIVFFTSIVLGVLYFAAWAFSEGHDIGRKSAIECMLKYNDSDLCEHYSSK